MAKYSFTRLVEFRQMLVSTEIPARHNAFDTILGQTFSLLVKSDIGLKEPEVHLIPVFFTIFLCTCEICKLQFALLVKNRARKRVEQTRQIVKFLCLGFPGKCFLRTKIKLNLISLPLPSAWACDLCPVESARNHVSCIKDVIWLADACLKEVEGKNEQDGRVLKAVSSGVVFFDWIYRRIFRFYAGQAIERINNVCCYNCWTFWRYRSLRVGSRRRNWRRFVLAIRCSLHFIFLGCEWFPSILFPF